MDSKILSELHKYKEHEECTCLECGYSGLMGVDKHQLPVWLRIILYMAAVPGALFIYSATGGGSLSAIFAVVCIAMPASSFISKRYLRCPSCGELLNRK